MPSRVFALSIHADYRCRHSGACCSADWDVPVELPVYRSLHAALDSGRLRLAPEASEIPAFMAEEDPPEDAAAVLERTDGGHCVFLDRDAKLCIIQRELGEPTLPSTCRHFPRLAVRDARGTFITLSHFCPTAAAMLFREDVPLSIVEAPAAFPPADYDGLAVGDHDLPPLLSPTMLMDGAGYGAWERHMVSRCASAQGPESVIATLMRDARLLAVWKPGSSTLAEAVDALPREPVPAAVPADLGASLREWTDLFAAVPTELRPAAPDDRGLADAYAAYVGAEWPRFTRPLKHYLAAKAFAS